MKYYAITMVLISAITTVASDDTGLSSSHDDIPVTGEIRDYDRTTFYQSNQRHRVTFTRNQDDDHTYGSDTDSKSTSSSKATKSAASNPYAISKNVVVSASSTTSSSSSRHNITIGDSIEFDDDSYTSNTTTTPISDMKDIMNNNIEMDSNATTVGKGAKVVLPPEHALSETWIIAIVALFVSMTISLCITTAIRRCRSKNRHHSGYQEVRNVVV
jgi:hypothetical protein